MSCAGGGQLPPPASPPTHPSPPPPEFDVDPELADNEASEEAAQAATIAVFDAATVEETRLHRAEEMGERWRTEQLQGRRVDERQRIEELRKRLREPHQRQ
jgi:hypothetical protein